MALSLPTTKVNLFLVTLFVPSAWLLSRLCNSSQCPLQKAVPVNGATKTQAGWGPLAFTSKRGIWPVKSMKCEMLFLTPRLHLAPQPGVSAERKSSGINTTIISQNYSIVSWKWAINQPQASLAGGNSFAVRKLVTGAHFRSSGGPGLSYGYYPAGEEGDLEGGSWAHSIARGRPGLLGVLEMPARLKSNKISEPPNPVK